MCVCACVCVCVETTCRHNTHHVKNDGVVSACYLHCDGWLVVCYGANVLPPVTQTETHTHTHTHTQSSTQTKQGWMKYSKRDLKSYKWKLPTSLYMIYLSAFKNRGSNSKHTHTHTFIQVWSHQCSPREVAQGVRGPGRAQTCLPHHRLTPRGESFFPLRKVWASPPPPPSQK